MKKFEVLPFVQRSRAALGELRKIDSQLKNQVLKECGNLLQRDQAVILRANQRDLKALAKDAAPAFRDRLTLTPARLAQMRESLFQVVKLKDPVGEVVDIRVLKNGIKAKRVRAPLGVIFMIYESRPNVALEAFSLAFKAGNSIILRGGKEAQQTTAEIYRLIREALDQTGAPLDSLLGVTDPDRRIVEELLQQSKWIDVVVPRGGEKLIEFVVEHSKIPIIKNDRGLCHVYVHSDAQLEMALKIVENAKVQRPGVCNSIETLLVHQKISRQFLPLLAHQLSRFGVEWFGCPKTSAILKGLAPLRSARVENFDTEYLDLKINCKVVSTQDQAIAHIDRHGSRHSECIVTASRKVAQEFMDRVDAAAVYWNASTRFTDGFELGLGGELGISTQKLHVRGPVGLKELTSPRWMIEGTGQVRKS